MASGGGVGVSGGDTSGDVLVICLSQTGLFFLIYVYEFYLFVVIFILLQLCFFFFFLISCL